MKRLAYLVLYISLLGCVFWGLNDKIIYHNKQDIFRWLPFILIFPIQAVLVYNLSKSFGASPLYAKGIAALAILISGPVFGLYLKDKQQKELSLNGVETIGIIYKKWKAYKKYSKDQWLLRCHFQVDGRPYSTFSEEDRFNQYAVGDTLHVIYSTKDPENCIIKELDK